MLQKKIMDPEDRVDWSFGSGSVIIPPRSHYHTRADAWSLPEQVDQISIGWTFRCSIFVELWATKSYI